MVVTPDSTIRILKCPLRLDNLNQITFSDVSAQTTYFKSLPYLEDENLTYIRKDGVIRVGTAYVDFEDLLEYNYVMYQNTHYDNKWFYAYITNIEYKNDGMTEISIETDVFQTWQFDIVWKHSFIEREHVNDDTIGKHTVPEDIEMGEYISNGYEYTTVLDQRNYILCATTDTMGNKTRKQTPIGGIPYKGYVWSFETASDLGTFINNFGNFQQNIYACYCVPRESLHNASFVDEHQINEWTAVAEDIYVTKQTTLNGFSPINNKLKCFPYNYLLVSNNNGQSNILHYERFNNSSYPTRCDFILSMVGCIGCDIRLTPFNYDGMNRDEQNSIMGGKWPTLSWSQDMFTNWLSQNAVNIGLGIGASTLSIAGGAVLLASGGGAMAGLGLIGAGVSGITGSMAQKYQHSMDPNSFKGNVNSGYINASLGHNGFYFYKMSIKKEYAQMIDEYFGAYGYKVNRLGTPHIHVRTNWDFLKTINCNIEGNIPEKDMIKLREICNTGCTFWHTTQYFLDYSKSNNIIT